ncbi:MAG: serine/threonine-protein kinase [Thermoanaerobaculia bacterium]
MSVLLEEGLELTPGDERQRWLAATAGRDGADRDLLAEVAQLLAASEMPSAALDTPIDSRFATLFEDRAAVAAPAPTVGDRVGVWKLVAPLGRGGMGEVFLAERSSGDFAQRAAIKLLSAGWLQPEVQERFRQERRILARLEHPGIARFLDGGVTADGTPFFALEVVDGEPITRYCAARRATVCERLGLFLEVCDAVDYAHRNLVVHCDLKPSNILVTADGHPKLLDFGIASALRSDEDQDAPAGAARPVVRALTPEYAAPEQIAGGPLTTATDVYSLGVLLHELLAGRLPYSIDRGAPESFSRAILEQPSTRPSAAALVDASRPEGARLARCLRGDLDRIVLRALAKEPSARYRSVQAFADDLRRHLDGRPIDARRDELGYRFGKFVGRHRFALAGGAATFLALAGGLVATAWQARRAEGQAALARQEAASSAASLAFLADLFAVSDPAQAKGRSFTDRELLALAAERLDHDLAGKPGLQVPLLHQLASIHMQRGEYAEGIALARREVELQLRRFGPTAVETARSRSLLANLLWLADQPAPARAHYRAVLASYERGGLQGSEEYLTALGGLATATGLLGDSAEEVRLKRQLVDRTRTVFGEESQAYGEACQGLGAALLRRGRYADAEPFAAGAAELWRKLYGLEHPDTLVALNNLAILEGNLGNGARVGEILREVLPVEKRIFGPDRSDTLAAQRLWARQQERDADFAGARATLAEVVAVQRRTAAASTNFAYTLNQVATVALAAGDPAAAELAGREAVATYQAAAGERSSWLLTVLGGVLLQRGKLGEAAALLTEAERLEREAGQNEGAFHAENVHGRGDLALHRVERAEARRLFAEALALWRSSAPEGSRSSARTLIGLLAALDEPERSARCRPLLGEAAAILARFLAPSHPERLAVEKSFAACPPA